MQNKSVLLIGNFLSASVGIKGHSEELARRLALAGWQVVTASARKNRLVRLGDMVATVWRQKSRYRVANVEVFSGAAFFWAEGVCKNLRFLGKPYILTLHGGNLPVFARRWPGRVRRLLTSAQVVVTPSRYLMAEMQEHGERFQLIPNPLDLSAYPYRPRREPQVNLVWLRAFQKIYNPRLALKVAALLFPEYPQLRLIMVGPDKGDGSWQEMPQLARELGLADRVIFQERVAKTEVPAWLNRGDIFLNTTFVDNAPVTVTEAMACGLCVVSTAVGGIPYLLTHEEDALLVPPDDPEAMAAAVRRILAEPGLARRLSENAHQKAEQFDWSVILPQWEALLMAVAEERRP